MSGSRARAGARQRRAVSAPADARAAASANAAAAHELPAVLAAGCVGLALLGAGLAVDVGAAAPFDAPKRLAVTVALVAAAVCLLAGGEVRCGWPTGRRRIVGWALVLAVAGAVVAVLAAPYDWTLPSRLDPTLAAPVDSTLPSRLDSTPAAPVDAIRAARGAIAWDGLRTLALFGLAVPLGASAALAGERGRRLLGCFLAVVTVNALVSLAQAAGLELFGAVAITGRTDTGALLGNEGHLAQLTALALVAVVAVGLVAPGTAVRGLLALLGALFAAALVGNRNLTALVALACGIGIAFVLWRGRGAVVALGLVVMTLVAAVAIVAPLRGRVVAAVQSASHGDWDAVTTYRLGPWAAALEMVRERPLVGFGPGTFGAEFTAHRLRAELRHERRFTIPVLTSSFGEAHSEYLQAAAEAGLPAALGVVVALGALLAGLTSVAVDPHDARRAEAVVLVALLGTGAVAALMWFPLQRPITALPLLLAAGRGWALLVPRGAAAMRRAESGGVRDDVRDGPRTLPGTSPRALPRVIAIVAVLMLGAALVPEFSRYAAERRLADATQAIAAVAAGGRVVPEAAPTLDRLGALARATADVNPSDTRGFVAAGTAALVAGKPAEARSAYRAALARGERAEIDLNLARAYALDGRREEAEAALLRAGWLSPVLLATLPSADQARIDAVLAEWSERLTRGALTAPPPLPEEAPPPTDPASRAADRAQPPTAE